SMVAVWAIKGEQAQDLEYARDQAARSEGTQVAQAEPETNASKETVMITLTDEQIQEKYLIGNAIRDVKDILHDYRDDAIVQAVRTVLPVDDDSSMLYMPCISTASKTSIIKTVSIFPVNKDLPTTQGNILVTDLDDGQHKATMEASYLTRLRTGAMTAIATDKLARRDASVLGVIGTGNMAFEQVLGVAEVRPV